MQKSDQFLFECAAAVTTKATIAFSFFVFFFLFYSFHFHCLYRRRWPSSHSRQQTKRDWIASFEFQIKQMMNGDMEDWRLVLRWTIAESIFNEILKRKKKSKRNTQTEEEWVERHLIALMLNRNHYIVLVLFFIFSLP